MKSTAKLSGTPSAVSAARISIGDMFENGELPPALPSPSTPLARSCSWTLRSMAASGVDQGLVGRVEGRAVVRGPPAVEAVRVIAVPQRDRLVDGPLDRAEHLLELRGLGAHAFGDAAQDHRVHALEAGHRRSSSSYVVMRRRRPGRTSSRPDRREVTDRRPRAGRRRCSSPTGRGRRSPAGRWSAPGGAASSTSR